jgi:hypothetical protein
MIMQDVWTPDGLVVAAGHSIDPARWRVLLRGERRPAASTDHTCVQSAIPMCD